MQTKDLVKQELTWVKAVREQNDSAALEKLFYKYLPLIENTRRRYQLRLFDQDDWRQEARIVCVETCRRFNEQQGSKFGSFYKLRLQNHWTNLLRQQLAVKRQTNTQAVSMEALKQANPDLENDLQADYNVNASKNEIEFLFQDFRKLLEHLSLVELQGLQMLLGTKMTYLVQTSPYSAKQISQASQRSRSKFMAFYHGVLLDI
ncbi:hypothetical protein MOO45_01595 [Bombilactobacillus folatiphilus]|uniref:Sigma-70 family RNA polymerase sigma factor n=1 Tax=Bombilactobacillus folatiphilus TaxID=2923362 RepID=A0ABY4P9W3_9LACO|nr:hypothetical protein [Bombilactobacillus folatiphilus]UQS82409.1 hypothetical protein MOO45_01595 [Bombilactobacillus folatiphilus]